MTLPLRECGSTVMRVCDLAITGRWKGVSSVMMALLHRVSK